MITTQQLIEAAPAAAATSPASRCSRAYNFVDTMEVLSALRGEGFVPVRASQRAVVEDRWDSHLHARHSIALHLEGAEKLSRTMRAAGAVPEMRLVNSSDGSTKFSLSMGVFRLVCANGLVAFREEGSVVETHRRISAQEVIARARKLSALSLPLFAQIAIWQRQALNDRATQRFAREALALRLPSATEEERGAWNLDSLLEVRRAEDAEQTLWNVLNRVQESAMRGLFNGQTAEGRALTSRPLTDIAREIRFNQQLWQLASAFSDKLPQQA